MATLSPRRPTLDLPVIVLSIVAILFALWGLGMGDGAPAAKDLAQAPVTLGGLVSRPIGVTGPATHGERLHAVPRLPATRSGD